VYIDDISIASEGSWGTASWVSVSPASAAIAGGGTADITLSLTAADTAQTNTGLITITSDNQGVADSTTQVNVTMNTTLPQAPTGFAANGWDDFVTCSWDDPSATMRSEESLTQDDYLTFLKNFNPKEVSEKDKMFLEIFMNDPDVIYNITNNVQANVTTRDFLGYTISRKGAYDHDSTYAELASGITGFSYDDNTAENDVAYKYAITASYSAGESDRAVSSTAYPRALASLPYASDFDGLVDDGGIITSSPTSNGGYNSQTALWQRGAPSNDVGPESAASGSNVWGTDLDTTITPGQYTSEKIIATA